MPHLDLTPGTAIPLPEIGSLPATVHVFSKDDLLALNMALATGRPLLVRGEPGSGKSQLARAAAVALKRPFLRTVVDARTESTDLLWDYDTVARLGAAQVLGALMGSLEAKLAKAKAELHPDKFTTAGPLWAAMNWAGAKAGKDITPHPDQSQLIPPEWKWQPEQGAVLLIDEIDKADSSVPSGLLSALGAGTFTTPGGQHVKATGEPPLIVITTNEDRVLPATFVRRCLVYQITIPSAADALAKWLEQRARPHFAKFTPPTGEAATKARNALYRKAAELLHEDRGVAEDAGLCPPGLAEYIDLLTAVFRWKGTTTDQGRAELLDELRQFALKKHPKERH